MVKKRIVIEGKRVHNVGYKPFLLAKARRLKVPNYEANNVVEEGKQKVIISLAGKEKQVQKFVEFIKENYPSQAKVSEIKEGKPPEDVMPMDEYQKVLDTEQHNTMVQAGLGMIEMQKETVGLQKKSLGKQDQMLGKQDEMLGKQDQMLGKQDEMLGKQDKTISILEQNTKETQELRKDMLKRFDSLERKYGQIAENMERILREMKEERKESREFMERMIKLLTDKLT